jgi:hypothetical protein
MITNFYIIKIIFLYIYMSNMSDSEDIIEIEKMSIDQFAGSVVLILGAIGSLLLVIWQSRCACRCRIGCSEKCYIFDCQREPPREKPPDEESPDNTNDKPPAQEKEEVKEEEQLIPQN